jgi:membrane-associated phospholipid phosphatase
VIANFRTLWLWPLTSGLVLAAAISHPLWTIRDAQLTGDFLSHTVYQSFLALAAILLLWRGARGEKRICWWPLLAGLLIPLVVEGLKRATRLPRPDGDPSGFPSGHTTASFALAWLLTRVYPRGAPLWFAVAVSIGWSRIEGHAHFPYQVLCGACFGTIIGWLISQKIAKPPSGARLAPVTKSARGNIEKSCQ